MKPIIMPFGMDTFESIGKPPLSGADLNDPSHKYVLVSVILTIIYFYIVIRSPIDLWRTLFCKHFPQDVCFYFMN
jgi:hypothetical protein